MKNLLKSYFMFFANRGPARLNFYGFCLAFGGILAASILRGFSFGFLFGYSVIPAVLFIGHNILIYGFKGKYFVMPFFPEKYFTVLVFKEGQKILVDKPLWCKDLGSYEEYHVRVFANYGDCQAFATYFLFESKNGSLSMSFNANLKFSYFMPDKLKIFDALFKKYSGDTYHSLHLTKYLKDIFKENNNCQSEIDKFYAQYLKGEISEHVLLDDILSLLTFPKETLFDGIKIDEIYLSDLKFTNFHSKKI